MDFEFLNLPSKLVQNLPLIWTFFLLNVRYVALMLIIPGIGGGAFGLTLRLPATLAFAMVSLQHSPQAQLPEDSVMMVAALTSEFAFGFLIGLIPFLIVNGVHMAGNLAGMTMGLQASQLIDPTVQTSLPDLSRIWGDLVIILFLLLDGHHLVFQAAAGISGGMVPGSFIVSGHTVEFLIQRSADVFRAGIMISSPIVVALLLTNFVMGLISRAVPQVNILIVSFPLTIGIGLVLSVLALPEIVNIYVNEWGNLDEYIYQAVSSGIEI